MTAAFRRSSSPSRVTADGAGSRCCGYYRVSTGRQAESDLSIPDQTRQVEAFCLARGWELAAGYVDAGVSATDDSRSEFQRMIERACDDDRPFDVIVVHSYSRFFRDAFGLEMYIRKLAKVGVRLVSITQELGEDPAQVMMRQVIALFDEYQSRENGKHVLRAMKENARQGFYNGSRLPLGYTTEEVEKRGIRTKKRLVVDPVEAEAVQLIFKLYRVGDGRGGPLGIKKLVCWLNDQGYRSRLGGRFSVNTVHGILTNPIYVGEWSFNRRNAKTQALKPDTELIRIDVPAIVTREEFNAVHATMKINAPANTPPRIVTGPILLTGLTTCASCGGAMTLRTGTSKSGKVHRYYSCSTANRQGKSGCKGRSIPVDTLDTLVTNRLVERLFQPERLTELLTSLCAHRAEKQASVDARATRLQTEVTEAEDKLRRLYKLVEDGLSELDDILKERITALKLAHGNAKAALDRIRASKSNVAIDPAVVEKFGRLMRESITTGDIPFRKTYIRSVVDRIEVDDNVIRIVGDKTKLEKAVTGKPDTSLGVRSFARDWRGLRESNPSPQRERLVS